MSTEFEDVLAQLYEHVEGEVVDKIRIEAAIMCDEAYEEGRRDGYDEGYDEGSSEDDYLRGYDEGRADGFQDGFDQAIEEGYWTND